MSNDIKITAYNETPEDYTLVFFQQDPSINGMYTKIFPTAWQLIKLGGVKNGGVSGDVFFYPISMQVGVKEHDTPYSPNTRFLVQNVDLNSKWNFNIDDGYQHMEVLPEHNVDGTISCTNNAHKKVDISICKNNKPLLVFRGQDQKGVSEGNTVNLQLTPKLYVMWASEMQEGELFTSFVDSSHVQEIDLTNASEIDVSLILVDPDTGKKEWKVIKRENN